MMVTTQLSGVSNPFSLRLANGFLFGIVLYFYFVCSVSDRGDWTEGSVGTSALRNVIDAIMPTVMKKIRTTSWVMRKGGSFCFGATAFSAGIFWKAWTIPTKTLK